ncbi:MAG TPA: hypothetical protein VD840_12720 [Sinorhizobium sp.]|nr:hypothetical protein [Sinorhizobium sp.]
MDRDDDDSGEPSTSMVEHLARRLVDRYGREAPAEAAQIVALLTDDGNLDQARVWIKVRDACRRMVARPGEITRKE